MDHVDACDKQLPGVLPSPGVTRPRRVAVSEIVHQRHRGPAGQYRAKVYLLKPGGALVRAGGPC